MTQFLIISGYIFWAVLVLALLGVLFLYRRFKRNLVRQAITRSLATGPDSMEVKLHPEENVVWKQPEQINTQVRQFENLGFNQVGQFKVEGLPDAFVVLFIHGEHPFSAVVYELADLTWADICVEYENSNTLTVSSAMTWAGELDSPDYAKKIFISDASPQELLKRVLEEIEDQPTITPTPETATQMFEEGYARDAAWRKERGANPEEIIRIAGALGVDLSGEEVTLTEEMERERLCYQALRTFLGTEPMTALEWEDIREQVAIILTRDEWDDLDTYALEVFDDDQLDTLRELMAEGITATRAIAMVNENAGNPLKLLGETVQPKAAFYRYPVMN